MGVKRRAKREVVGIDDFEHFFLTGKTEEFSDVFAAIWNENTLYERWESMRLEMKRKHGTKFLAWRIFETRGPVWRFAEYKFCNRPHFLGWLSERNGIPIKRGERFYEGVYEGPWPRVGVNP